MQSKVCDVSVCRGTEAVRFLEKPTTVSEERFTSAQLQKYFQDLSGCLLLILLLTLAIIDCTRNMPVA